MSEPPARDAAESDTGQSVPAEGASSGKGAHWSHVGILALTPFLLLAFFFLLDGWLRGN